MTAGITAKRIDAHTHNEHRIITCQYSKRVTTGEVCLSLSIGHAAELVFCSNRIGAYAGTEYLGIVLVVMVVRALPYAYRGKVIHAIDGHNNITCKRAMQYGMVLVVVIYYKHPYHK